MTEQTAQKRNRMSFRQRARDGVLGLVAGTLASGAFGVLMDVGLALATPPELIPERMTDYYQIAGIMAINGAAIGAVMGLAGELRRTYEEIKEHRKIQGEIQRNFQRQLRDEWGYIP